MAAPSTSTPRSGGRSKQSSSNIRVVGRIRPLAKYEKEKGCKQVVSALPTLTRTVPTGPTTEPEVLQIQPPSGEKRWFELDAIFDECSTQQDVYIKSGAQQAVCEDIFRGFNCTILAYGQTGAGKTFTMGTAANGSDDITDNDGVIPRACADLFRHIDEKCDGNAQVELSYMEIYNEEIRDLMADGNNGGGSPSALRIRETLNGEVYVSGLQSQPVDNPRQIGHFMEAASSRRVVASTKMNATSSRSHAICVLRIKGVLEDSTKFQAKLTLVDLAGSERIKKTGAGGTRAQEGININKGLFILGQVVSALAEQRPKFKRKPPYRDSKLTRLLQDSLGGNSRTIMVACVSPADFNLDESINTLRYATSARNIKNTATRNVIKSISPEEAAKIQRDNELLRRQVAELQQALEKMSMDTGSTVSSSSSSDSDDDSTANLARSPSADSVVASAPSESGEKMNRSADDSAAPTKREKHLEKEVDKLTSALKHAKADIRKTAHGTAVELPSLKMQLAKMQEKVNESKSLEEENAELRRELEETKADAASSRQAANKLSEIMDQLRDLKGDEIEKKQMEHDHVKVEESWVNFVFQVLETHKEQMRKLREDFYLVVRVVESPDVRTPTTIMQRNWWGGKQVVGEEMAVDPELRQKLLSEHIQFFNEKMLEIEDEITDTSESLNAIRESLRRERDKLELDIGTTEFIKDSLNKDDGELLNQLTALLIGPVKPLD